MTELAIKVIETTPAVVSFNYQEISDHLDAVLSKYRGLVFTDSTVTECKKTIAELRKGQKSLDEFRKATKKQLTESVTAFENQCKTLYGKFDEVIQPLTQQQNQFEAERKEKKRVEIQEFIDSLILEHTLAIKYACQLRIPEEYFNKGKSMKDIRTELTALANTLKVQRDKEVQDMDLVTTKVELANAQYQLTSVLLPMGYLRLLDHKSVAEIDALITSDAQEIHDKERKAAEALKAETVEAPIAAEVMSPVPTAPPVMVMAVTPSPVATPAVVELVELTTVVYEITSTEEQLLALEAYLDANVVHWADRP